MACIAMLMPLVMKELNEENQICYFRNKDVLCFPMDEHSAVGPVARKRMQTFVDNL
jgi:hypothetical protein